MASSEIAVPFDFLLARDELLYVLSLLSVTTIPGLEDDPAGEMTSEQQAIALRVAGRTMRARQLASVHDDGEVVLQNNLLAAVATCALGQQAIFVNHWAVNQTLPMPLFAHISENNFVIHTRPADVLHLFSLRPSFAELLQQIFSICEFTDRPVSNAIELKVPSALLAQVRERAEAGAKSDAVNLLVANGNATQGAEALVDTLATQYRTSSMQLAKQRNGQPEHEDGLLLQDNQNSWLVTTSSADTTSLIARKVTQTDIQGWLTKWLTV